MAERIAYLVSQYPTLSHSFIFREIRELRRLGLEIEVASILRPDREPADLTPDERQEADRTYYVRADLKRWPGLHLRTIVQRPSGYWGGLALAFISAKWNLVNMARHLRFFGEAVAAGQWLQRLGFPHVHTHFASTPIMLMQRVFGSSVSMTIHGSAEFIDPMGFCMAEKIRCAKLVVGISRYGCSQLMRFSDAADWDKVSMVRLGINPDDFQPGVSHVPHDYFEVVCVGRLVPVKAYRFLIGACARLRSEGRNVRLTIIGGGPERGGLEAHARALGVSGAIVFTGPLENRIASERVKQADCFALASFAEGVPVVLMEAMALGIPCVATRVTGVPELIEHEHEGLLIPPADEAALAAAIARLMDDPELRTRLGENGRRKVLREYDLRANAQILKEHFASLVS